MKLFKNRKDHTSVGGASPLSSRRIEVSVLDNTGHTKTSWDAGNPDEVASAKAQFAALTEKGYRVFRVKRDGSEGERITKFDPEAEALIYSKALTAG